MSKVTLNNPIANQVSLSVSQASANIGVYGQSLNTGIKANNDVISTFLGRGLNDQSNILTKILSNTSYSVNSINVAQSALQGIGNILSDMLGIVAQAIPNSPNLGTLQTSLNQKLDQILQITSSTQFDGTELLTGALSSNPTLTPKYPTNNSVNATYGAPAPNTIKASGHAAANSTIQANGVVVGDQFSITIGGVTTLFTAVAAGSIPGNNQFAIVAGDNNATAQNIALAIENSSVLALQGLKVDVAGSVVTVTQTCASSLNGVVAADLSAGHLAAVNNVITLANSDGIDLSGIKLNTAIFSGTPVVNFQATAVTASANGGNEARILATQGGALLNNAAVTLAGAANGDQAATYTVTIGGTVFNGALFMANGGDLNNAQLKMTAQNGDYFVVNFAGGFAGTIDTLGNAGAIATTLNGIFAGTTFSQNDSLDIDTSAGNIVSGGQIIGSVSGMSARFNTSGDFSSQNVKDFTIVANQVGDITLTAVINNGKEDINYTTIVPVGNINTLVAGKILSFTNSNNSDKLSLNIGQLGLTSLANPNTHNPIATAIKRVLTGGNGLQVRTGLAYTDVTTVSIPNVSGAKIFLDNNGTFIANLDLKTQVGAAQATQVITNALNKIRNEQANLQSFTESIKTSAKNLESLIQVTKDASNGYLDTDLVEAASGFSKALKAMIAAISTLGAGARVADAAQDIIRQAAN